MTASSPRFLVALIGHGAIGSRVAAGLRAASDFEVVGVVTRRGSAGIPDLPTLTIAEACAQADLVVECAGGDAVREHAERILESGVDLLISSIGALADPHLRNALLGDTPHRSRQIDGIGPRRGQHGADISPTRQHTAPAPKAQPKAQPKAPSKAPSKARPEAPSRAPSSQPGSPVTRDPRGVLYLTAGAIGGLDLLGAAACDGGLTSASLTSTKTASTLVQPWMDAAASASLRAATAPVTVFRGTVAEAARLFPSSLNVAAALAHATGLWDELTVTLIGDPATPHTTHHITADGPSGSYRFEIANHPLPDNPASSGLVSAALLRDIRAIAHPHGTFA